MSRYPSQSNSRLVYSTQTGRVANEKPKETAPVGDGTVRVWPEKKGRGGKVVTVIAGLPLVPEALTALAKQLKKRCGGGGTVKEGTIELQGDHVELMVETLKKQGYKAKRAGGAGRP